MGLMARNNDMVQDPNVDECASRPQGLGQDLVGRAGFGRPGRMVVRQDHAGRIDRKSPPNNLAWIHRCLSQRPPKQFFSHNEAVSGVQEKDRENLEGTVAQPQLQKARDLGRVGQRIASCELIRKRSSGQFKCCPQQRTRGLTDSAAGTELLIVGGEQASQTAKVLQ